MKMMVVSGTELVASGDFVMPCVGEASGVVVAAEIAVACNAEPCPFAFPEEHFQLKAATCDLMDNFHRLVATCANTLEPCPSVNCPTCPGTKP